MPSIFELSDIKPKSPSNKAKASPFEIPAMKTEEPSKKEKEGIFQSTLRHGARTIKSIQETIQAEPAEILSLANIPAKYITEKTTGKPGKEYEELPISKYLKTNKKLEEERPEYLKPKSTGESTWDEAIKDITSLLLPLPGGKTKTAFKHSKNIKDFLTKVGKRIIGASSSEAAGTAVEKASETLGISSDTAKWLKMGTVLTSELLQGKGKGAEGIKNALYQEATQTRGPNAVIRSNRLKNEARRLQIQLESGGSSPSSSAALTKTKELLEKIKKYGNYFPVQELEDFAIKINELKKGLYKQPDLDKAGLKLAKSNLQKASSLIESGIEEYASTNPKYKKLRTQAKEAHRIIEQSRKVSGYIAKHAKGLAKGGLGTVLLEAFTHPSAIIPTLTGAAVSYAGIKGGELITRMIKSTKHPELKEYYLNVLDGAVRKDTAFMNHNIQKIEKVLEKDPNALLEED